MSRDTVLNLNLPGTDSEKKEAGVWIEFDETISFKIGSTGTKQYRDAAKRALKPYKRQMDNGTLSESKSNEVMNELMVNHILLGWKGIMNGKEEFKYNSENAMLLMSSDAYKEINEWIWIQANEIENFRLENVKK